jgi:serine/threonine protein phosphatase PrpC
MTEGLRLKYNMKTKPGMTVNKQVKTN